MIFGPLTLLRPPVVIAGGALGWARTTSPAVHGLVVLVMGMMLAFESALDRGYRARPAAELIRTAGYR